MTGISAHAGYVTLDFAAARTSETGYSDHEVYRPASLGFVWWAASDTPDVQLWEARSELASCKVKLEEAREALRIATAAPAATGGGRRG